MVQTTRFLAALGVCALATLAHAADEGGNANLQKYTFDNNVAVVNGGVGLGEVAAVKQMAPSYPLRVIISGRDGDYYVANRMTISRNGQTVAQIPDAGPWLLVDLPPGRYTLEGEFPGGLKQSRQVTVAGGGGRTLHWVLPPTIN